MSMRIIAGTGITRELISSILMKLTTVSRGVDTMTLVNGKINDHKDSLIYTANNDIGLCIDRIANNIGNNTAENADGIKEDHYLYGRNDSIIDQTMEALASRMTATLSSAVYILRDVVPGIADKLTASVQTRIPHEQEATNPTIGEFTWGSLNSPAHQMDCIATAREYTCC